MLLLRPSERKDPVALKELRGGLPFLDIAIAAPKRFELYVKRLFAADRFEVVKGMVEVQLDARE